MREQDLSPEERLVAEQAILLHREISRSKRGRTQLETAPKRGRNGTGLVFRSARRGESAEE
jgi:hypothetical protein